MFYVISKFKFASACGIKSSSDSSIQLADDCLGGDSFGLAFQALGVWSVLDLEMGDLACAKGSLGKDASLVTDSRFWWFGRNAALEGETKDNKRTIFAVGFMLGGRCENPSHR